MATTFQNILPQFQAAGCGLYERGLITTPAGNLSIRHGSKLIITKSGSSLAFLDESDLTQTGISTDDANTPLASSELAVHRAIYKATDKLAVVHAHPPCAVALSHTRHHIAPTDIEGILCFPYIPVIGPLTEPAPGNLADEIAEALREYPIVVVHRHGTFAAGKTLQEAYIHTEVFEYSCHIMYMLKMMKR